MIIKWPIWNRLKKNYWKKYIVGTDRKGKVKVIEEPRLNIF